VVPVMTVQVNRSYKPILVPKLLHFERDNKHLFFVPDIPDWIVVNKNSAFLLLSCDGQKSAEEIFSEADLDSKLKKDATLLFDEAQRRGVLTDFSAQDKQEYVPEFSSVKHYRQRGILGSVYLKLTDECNLSCDYCYAGSGKPSEVLSIDTLRRLLQETSEISDAVTFVLTGGEPLMHPRSIDFAEEIVSAGNSVHLLTNGALITTTDLARRIATTTNLVKISLDGSTEKIHALSRGMGNFDLIVRAIDMLIKYDANVSVAMTVTKNNAHDVATMSARYGSRLTLQPLFKAGRGKTENDISLTGEEYYRTMAEVESIAPMGNLVTILESLRGRGVKKCAMADREISISENGDVYPCQLLHAPEFCSGNIYEKRLADIYYNSPVLKRLRKVNVDTIEECSKCAIRLICAGGCRARDYHESGSIEVAGEFCEYEKLAFINGLLDYSEII